MKMDKMFAGLIAFVAGVALSAGSAFATNGYVGGDTANMKLVPYYETGDTTATVIGIQNMSPQQASTIAKNTAVTAAQTALDTAKNAATPDPTTVANAEKALADAKKAAYTEHTFITVNVYDAMGMMMKDASVTLCLAENQFGYVILQGPMMQDWQTMDSAQNKLLSVADGDIPAYGYVQVMAGTKKYTGCTVTGPDGLTRVDNDNNADNTIGNTDNMVAAWTIIQDTGDGFFGTEVPTATVSMGSSNGTDGEAGTSDDGKPEFTCYGGTDGTGATNTAAPNVTGDFSMKRCGLIPERHDKGDGTLTHSEATTNGVATARYDAGDESMVYVWLAAGGDTEKTKPSERRMLFITVVCEDGSKKMAADVDGNPGPIKVGAPGMLTMIDPSMGDVGMYTDMCEGDRGMLEITMPTNSRAGAVFTHITQMMGHYRMNFPGYGKASQTDLCTTADGEEGDNVDDCM